MLNRTIAFMSFAVFALAACSSDFPKPSPDDSLIGCWAGEDFQPVFQRTAKWLTNRKPDGTFVIEFSITERGVDLPVQTEEGKWHHKNGIYTTRTLRVAGKSVDTSDPHYTDSYEIKSVANGLMTYHHPKTNLAFTSKKVACTPAAT